MTGCDLSFLMRHGALWMSDPWYRRAWFVGPHLAAVLAIVILVAKAHAPAPPIGATWAHPSAAAERSHTLEVLRDRARTDPAAATDLERKADAGDLTAQFLSGTLNDPILNPGNVTPERTAKALARYRQAAEQGNAASAFNLAGLLLSGRYGIARNFVEARALYEKVAGTFSPAQRQLGVMAQNGWGSPSDRERGMQLIRIAAERGDALSELMVAEALDRGLSGVKPDIHEAISWFEKAAIQNNVIAQRELAIHLLQGNGVAPDPERATYWFRQAAARGDSYAKSQVH